MQFFLKKRIRVKPMLAVLFLGLFTYFFVADGIAQKQQIFFLNVTASLPRGLYMAIPGDSYREGDLVVYTPTESVTAWCIERGYVDKPQEFIKQVGALEGSRYQISDQLDFRVNGKYIGKVIDTDLRGRPMPLKIGYHFVPEDEFLPIAAAYRSMDGRYTGTIPLKNIKARVIPIATEW